MLKYKLYLGDIMRAIERIEKSIKGKNINDFKTNDEMIDSTSMRLQIIGESLGKIDEKLKKKYKINSEKYSQTRNIISHAYFAINHEILWSIIQKDIPILKRQIEEILAREK